MLLNQIGRQQARLFSAEYDLSVSGAEVGKITRVSRKQRTSSSPVAREPRRNQSTASGLSTSPEERPPE